MNVNFTFHLGDDNLLEVEAEVSRFVGADMTPGSGQPAEGGEVEITDVRLVGEDRTLPFQIGGLFIQQRGFSRDASGKLGIRYTDLESALIEAAAEKAWEEDCAA
jgi:hypothetical protein